ncbi:MAG TPA: hypothetical protein VF543_14965 [Pyrinomonadaceae bacterium]
MVEESTQEPTPDEPETSTSGDVEGYGDPTADPPTGGGGTGGGLTTGSDADPPTGGGGTGGG